MLSSAWERMCSFLRRTHVALVEAKLGALFVEFLQGLLRDGDNFWRLEGGSLLELYQISGHLSFQTLIYGVFSIFVVFQEGVVVQIFDAKSQFFGFSEIFEESFGALAQAAGIDGKRLLFAFDGCEFRFPGLVACKNIFRGPHVLFLLLASL